MSEPQRRELERMFNTYVCPDCGYGLVAVPGAPNLLRCNRCEKDFFAPQADAEESQRLEAASSAELDALRIQRTAAMRRAANRSESYAIIAALACAGIAAQLAWLAAKHVRRAGWELRPIIFLGLILVMLGCGVWLVRRALELHRQTRRSTLSVSSVAPDFSALADESQIFDDADNAR